jgi:acetyl esterase/lipase
MRRTLWIFCSLSWLFASPLPAQAPAGPIPLPAPAEPSSIPLNTGGVKGMPAESWLIDNGQRSVRNVSHATLTPVLPVPGKGTGAAVIVLPGGAFVNLAMDNEGWPTARWLADRGIAAFVLKYRLRPTPSDHKDYLRFTSAERAKAMAGKLNLAPPPQAVEDGKAALRLVRSRAQGWGIDPARIGMLGYSAGAMTTLSVTLTSDAADMPAFIAPIYGPMTAVKTPLHAPPMFLTLAADDPLFGKSDLGLATSWQQAGRPVELHFYERGGHGFGLGRPGSTTDGWLETFYRWLDMHEFLKPTAASNPARAGGTASPAK